MNTAEIRIHRSPTAGTIAWSLEPPKRYQVLLHAGRGAMLLGVLQFYDAGECWLYLSEMLGVGGNLSVGPHRTEAEAVEAAVLLWKERRAKREEETR